MTVPGGPSSADKKVLDAALVARRSVVRYRVDFTELPEGQEPDWERLIEPVVVEKWLYGAGWCRVLPIRPVMAHQVVPPTVRNYKTAEGKTRSETVHLLEGPIWPPR